MKKTTALIIALATVGAISANNIAVSNTGIVNQNTAGAYQPAYTSPYEDFADATSKTLPAAFPKGFNAFYCMKYEITQGQYADFLNKLSLTQATARYMAGYNTSNQSITGTHPAFTADAPDRSLAYLNYADFLSYLDWSHEIMLRYNIVKERNTDSPNYF